MCGRERRIDEVGGDNDRSGLDRRLRVAFK